MPRTTLATLTMLAMMGCSTSRVEPTSPIAFTRYVDEALASWWPPVGVRVTIEGTVDPGSWSRRPDELDDEFRLSHGGRSMSVRFHGLIPDLFREGGEAIVRGRFDSTGAFVADEVIARHTTG